MSENILYCYCKSAFKKCSGVILLISLLVINTTAYSQNPPYITYNEQNGLTTNVVYGLYQDAEDNIWFCTNAGVVKFNGNKLTALRKNDGLTSNEVFKIFEDSQHRLWFMTGNGRISFYYNRKIFNEKDYPVFASLKSNSFTADIREDLHHNIWIIPDAGNVYCLSGDLHTFRQVPLKTHNNNFFIYNGENYLASVEGIYSLKTGEIVLASNETFTARMATRHCQSDNIIYSAGDKKILVYDMKRSTTRKYEMPDLPGSSNSIVIIDSILYICTGKGMHLYKRSTLTKVKEYFSNSNVSHVLSDREGSLWISTLNEGVKYIPESRISFLRSPDYFEGNKILKVNGLGSHIIIGQSNSKVSYYHKGKMRPLVSPYESKGEGITYMISPFQPDTGFVISTQAGITKFTLPDKLEFKKENIFLSFTFSDKNAAYISTQQSLGLYDEPLDLPGFRSKLSKNMFDSVRTNAMYYDKTDSVLYACTKQGLFRYKNKKRLSNKFKELDGLSFTDIGKMGNNIFAVSTPGDGIFLFRDDQILQVNESSGLTNNLCTSLFIQNDSTVWVTTYNGLNRIIADYRSGKIDVGIRKFYRSDGLPSNYINDMYQFEDSIWLATNGGLAVFKEKDLTGNQFIPRLTIDEIKVNNSYVPVLKNSHAVLDRNSNNIIIAFNCCTFKNAGSVRYKYKMEAINSNWIETGNTQVDFTGLAPGKYTFEVFAYSLNGNWKTNSEKLFFTIQPAYWETIWFRILMAGLLLLAAILIINYQFRKVKNKFAIQKKIMNYEKELLELEQQALRLQMNPHFIFNALNSIQHSILSGKQEEAYNHLELFSTLIRGILENSKHKFISLEDEIRILEIYIQIEAARFDGNFKYELIIDPSIDTSSIDIPPMLIQPFVENSIWHGLIPKASGEKKLILSFTAKGNSIICTVDDNGIGRTHAANQKHKKNATPLGTTLTINRMKNINLIENNQKYSVDIYDKEEGTGTIVTITIQF